MPPQRPGLTRIPTASQMLARELRGRIIRERLADGTPLESEAQLIQSSGLSRASVREAIRVLESEGLITTRRGPGGGIRVSRPDLGSSTRSIAMILALSEAPLRELIDLRAMLEPQAARHAARQASAEQVELLRDAVSQEGSQLPGMMSFHTLIAHSGSNQFLGVMLEIVHSLAEWHTPLEALSAESLALAERAHHKIVDRIAARDESGAARAMQTHIDGFRLLLDAAGRLDEPVIRAADWNPGL